MIIFGVKRSRERKKQLEKYHFVFILNATFNKDDHRNSEYDHLDYNTKTD